MARRTEFNLENNINKAADKIKEKPQNAMREAGKILVKLIRANTPKSIKIRKYRGKVIKPGRLRKSIRTRYFKKDGTLYIGTNMFYAKWIEKGNSKINAQPFLENTIKSNINVVETLVKEALRNLK